MWDFQPLSITFRITILMVLLLSCLWLEHKRPLRKATQPKSRRVMVNLGIAAVGAICMRLIFYPLVLSVSDWTVNEKMGIINVLQFPVAINLLLAIFLLDYTLYIWHWLNHKVPFLWRFHNAHHVDLDLDVSTALRFHFGELVISTGYRSAQIVLFGIDPFTLILFETLVTSSAQLHHSNINLNQKFEKRLNLILVTPRMHGIHHSIVREETDSNFSTIFSFWDRVHKTIQLHIPQNLISIGVPSYRTPEETKFYRTLWLPFTKQKAWKLPDGTIPKRDRIKIADY